MKKTFLVLLTLVGFLYSQDKVKVTIQLISPSLNDSTTIYIVGNIDPLGLWRPDKVPMKKNSKEDRVFQFEIEKGTQVEYKFTKGNWQTEALGGNMEVPRNFILIPFGDTTVVKTIINWRDNFNFKVNGQITGKVVYHKNFIMDGLKPRNIFVWLPPNYEEEKTKHYPVFYMHDGQNLIDPKTSNTFIDWRMDEVADSLIRNGEVEPFIIVGINNTDDRAIEYNNTALGKLYMKLLVEKIKPFIDSNYRTLTDAANTAVGGSSMGGLISMMCAWEYPDVFAKAACFSPAFNINDIDYIRVVKNYSGEKKKLLFYIDNGGKGLESLLQPGVDSMINALIEKKYVEGIDLHVFIDEEAEHNEAAWSKRVWMPIKLFFGKN